jgi:Ca2+-binding RTX toxin-like protein
MPKLYVVANAIGHPDYFETNYGHLQIVHGTGTTWSNSKLTEVEVQRPIGSDYWDYREFKKPFETNDMRYQYIELSLKPTQTVKHVWSLIEQTYYSLKANGANINYNILWQNSNSFIKTLLYVIGNDENWLNKFSGSDLNSFPGWNTNVLFGAAVGNNISVGIALNLAGTAGNDIIRTGYSDDILGGAMGNDLIFSDAGNDSLFGGDGIDTLYGGLGYDSIFGGADNDLIFGGNGNDLVHGDAGNDVIMATLVTIHFLAVMETTPYLVAME